MTLLSTNMTLEEKLVEGATSLRTFRDSIVGFQYNPDEPSTGLYEVVETVNNIDAVLEQDIYPLIGRLAVDRREEKERNNNAGI